MSGGAQAGGAAFTPSLCAVRALLRLAAPMILTRAGLAAMTIVGAVLVAHSEADELAVWTLANGTFGRVVDIALAAVLSGAVLVAGAREASETARRLASWRRAVGFSALFALVGLAIAVEARPILTMMGQEPALAARAAPAILILALGAPAGLVAVASAVHLEAVGRAPLVTYWMLAANLLNLGLGVVLIDGALGLPALGAWGAALTSGVVRLALAIVLTATLRALEGPALFRPAPEAISPRQQLALGSSASGTAAAMNFLGVWLTIFAGWLGALPLAAFASVWTINLPGLVMALGVADAVAIRAAAAKSNADAQMRGDLTFLFAALGALALAIAGCAHALARAYAADPAVQHLIAGLLPYGALALWLDGCSLGVSSGLRAKGDIGAPTAIQIGAMAATPLLGGFLALLCGLGVHGLFYGIVVTSAARLALLVARLMQATAPAARLIERAR